MINTTTVRITKVSGGASMRTKTMVGELVGGVLPGVGDYPVIVNALPLDDTSGENMRMFNTSILASYEDTDEGRLFTTESGSVYLIAIAGDNE